MKYILVDAMNTYFRARHAVNKKTSIEDRLGSALHITITSLGKCWREQKADKIVWCLDGKSWRRDFYPQYKLNRKVKYSALTDLEKEEDAKFFENFNNLNSFIIEKTNCTVLHNQILEADDLIAGWVHTHPADTHVIISSDSDYIQLLNHNVNIYNGVQDVLVATNGIFTQNKPAKVKKTGELLQVPDPEWVLFEKCMRGDPTDNVFSAYPGVRAKSSKKKVGLLEAFKDKNKQGFYWNNLMLSKWVDHNGKEQKVIDCYNRNKMLIDLSAQPDNIKQEIHKTITSVVKKNIPQIGINFLKFCGKYDLQKLSDQSKIFAELFSA